jgi:hypothetical protein
VSKSALIPIPVPPHVRQFLLKKFGADPHHVHQNTYIGRQVLMVTEKLPYRLTRVSPPPMPSSCYRIILPSVLKHHSITEDGRRALGAALEKYFLDCMISYINGFVAATQNERAGLRAFFALYDINPDDYDLETGRKAYRDYKDRVLRYNDEFLALNIATGALAMAS